jgi:hypothetical protein
LKVPELLMTLVSRVIRARVSYSQAADPEPSARPVRRPNPLVPPSNPEVHLAWGVSGADWVSVAWAKSIVATEIRLARHYLRTLF